MATNYLKLAEGTLAYDDSGGIGPLVILLPSLGDLRGEYRLIQPSLAKAGYRVVAADLRGHGDSSTGWPDYSVAAVGRDILALIDHLQAGPAVVVGTSFAAAAAVWAAAEQPQAVAGLVLVGAFVRDHQTPAVQKLAIQVTLNGPWKVRAWDWFYKSLYPSQLPADFDQYRQRLRANLSEPGRFAALKAMALTSKGDTEARLSHIEVPTLVVMGSRDPDFPSPEAEAQLIAERTGGTVAIIENAGHYPHAEMPTVMLPQLIQFLKQVEVSDGQATRA